MLAPVYVSSTPPGDAKESCSDGYRILQQRCMDSSGLVTDLRTETLIQGLHGFTNTCMHVRWEHEVSGNVVFAVFTQLFLFR